MAKIYVDCKDKAGKEIYDKIIQTSLEDTILGKSLIEVKMICREDEPFFVIGALPKSTSKPIKMRDIVSIEETKKENGKTITKLKIEDETYAPQLLKKINIIDQPSRFEIITDSPIDMDEVIHDAKDDFILKLLDFMNRVFPEGMRIRKTFYGKSIVMIASEKPFTEEWIKKALELKEELEKNN
ncbi:methanogenesis marker 17 protein [Methanothermococcus okinawensis]|uniref:Methanogenesis marker protein 17 n=1 Tax=Methanothermococcus okinawensis (strain DSM 14208 / JCM 11175 / IH1) TaxID=647113 RepID=F8ALI6_METOI|nr:methanogenesis marker 17 protein [Methanothermococcus okinawensis]AEH07079.1 methanogenesis marker protein 17 [Methanothermococcus okinawensis IH1]